MNLHALARLLPAIALASSATCQCPLQWIGGGVYAGADGAIFDVMAVDPDGAGPLTERLVIGGAFQNAGTVVGRGVAAWDPASTAWSRFGSGLRDASGIGRVSALATLPGGDLVAAGVFRLNGNPAFEGVARWDGTSWSPLRGATGLALTNVTALRMLPNGDLVAGVTFIQANYATGNGVALWNGTEWALIGGLFTQSGSAGILSEFALMPNGDLVVGGRFDDAGGVAVSNIARWNGSTWSAIGTVPSLTQSGSMILSLAVLPNGDLVAGGDFGVWRGDPFDCIARWNGTQWQALGPGLTTTGFGRNVKSLLAMPNGDLIASGGFTNAGVTPVANIARWDGTSWSPLGTGISSGAEAMTLLSDGRLVAAGNFTAAGGQPVWGMALWDGSAWSPPAA